MIELKNRYVVKKVTSKLKEMFPKVKKGHVINIKFCLSELGSFVKLSTETYEGFIDISLHDLYVNFIIEDDILEEF